MDVLIHTVFLSYPRMKGRKVSAILRELSDLEHLPKVLGDRSIYVQFCFWPTRCRPSTASRCDGHWNVIPVGRIQIAVD